MQTQVALYEYAAVSLLFTSAVGWCFAAHVMHCMHCMTYGCRLVTRRYCALPTNQLLHIAPPCVSNHTPKKVMADQQANDKH